MPDLSHLYGADLAVGAGGDLATVDATRARPAARAAAAADQSRRLSLEPFGYGAGLGQFVGQPANAARIRSVIRSQIFQEAAVARSPEPTIDVAVAPDGAVTVAIRYADATTGATQTPDLHRRSRVSDATATFAPSMPSSPPPPPPCRARRRRCST